MVAERPLVSLDLELTSSRPEQQAIIEIGAVKFAGGRVLDVFSTLVSPPVAVPLATQVLTGIHKAELARAPRVEHVLPRLTAFLGDSPLVGHSIGLDVAALARQGLSLGNEQLDTFELASVLLPQLESYSLAALVRHLGIKQPIQHRALADAQVTRLLFLSLLERAHELDMVVLREINALTSRTTWPLRAVFQAMEEQRSRTPAAGASIREALAAKLGPGDASLDTVLTRERFEPLRARTPERAIDVAETARLAARGGPIAGSLENFEERPQQLEMLRAVAETLNDGGSLIVEAGTGTGKTLAYLVPAIEYAMANDERVVISTNTINLQEQLYLKDVPDIRRGLARDFRATVLKGRQNYLCFQRWDAMRRRPDLSFNEIVTLVKILVWLPRTETGDVGELNLTEGERAVWSRLNSQAELCSPRRCTAAGKRGCFLQYARERAAASHLVIVNHALLLSDLATGNAVIPDYRCLIVDEAHHLEAQATEQLAFACRFRDVVAYLDELSHTTGERRSGLVNELSSHFRGSRASPSSQRQAESLATDISKAVETARASANAFFAALGTFLKSNAAEARGYDQRLRITEGIRSRPGWTAVEESWEPLESALGLVQEPVDRLQGLIDSLDGHGLLEYESLAGRLLGAVRIGSELRSQLAAIVNRPQAERVYWASVSNGEPALHAAPLRVGPILREQLFQPKHAAVLTSATLTTGGSFSFVREQLGLEDAREVSVGSPFDYASSAILYLPSDVPSPDERDYGGALARSLVDVCSASEGRALVLFTSHSQLRQSWQAIRRPLEERGILVLGHGVDGTPRRHLLQTFKNHPRSVLLGAASFWEGVDVVGEGLSVLAIAKLPFAVPTDPIVAARSELFDEPFTEYSLPSAVLKFKQGFGRLIRSRSDRGIVICYDRRLQTKAYGDTIVRSLPPVQVKRGRLGDLPGTVAAWLKPPPD